MWPSQAIGHLFPSTDIGDAMFVARNDHFGAARERFAIFATSAAGLAGSFLRKNNFAGASFADSAADAA